MILRITKKHFDLDLTSETQDEPQLRFHAAKGKLVGGLDLANRFKDHDDLRAASDGIGFDLAPRGPIVGRAVKAHVAEHQAALDPVKDQTDVAAGVG